MGVGIIAMFIGGGWKVDVVSRSASTRDGLAAATAKALAGMGKPTDTSGLKTFATLPEADWSKIDVAVETVTEDLPLKQKLFAEMEALARPDCRADLEFLELPDQRDRQGAEDAEPHDGPALLHAGASHPAGRGGAARCTPIRRRPSGSARS